MESIETALWSLASIAVGAGITWLVARRYYVAAALDLAAETARIRNLLRIALQAMENANMVKLNRDAEGNPIGMVHEAHVADTISVTGRASGDVLRRPDGA